MRTIFGFVLLFCFVFPGHAQTPTIRLYAGGKIPAAGTQAANYAIGEPSSVITDTTGAYYIASKTHSRIYRVAADGSIQSVNGATVIGLSSPFDIVLDSAGNIYFSDYEGHRVYKAAVNGAVSVVAGNDSFGYRGDGGLATAAAFMNPWGLAVDSGGNLYIADQAFHVVRKVTPAGIVSTVAGTGTSGYGGDGGPATAATLNNPSTLAVDGSGNLYIADSLNHRIRKVTPNGIINTIAGTGIPGYSGDNGPAVAAQLNTPFDVAVDSAGTVYIADTRNNRIRKITTDGVISTVAGNGKAGFLGDGGPATAASLSDPFSVAVGGGGLYIADRSNRRIRRVTADGVIRSIAGNGYESFSGDGGLAPAAQFNLPNSIAMDGAGNLYIADTQNFRLRRISAGGQIATVAGTGEAITSTGTGPRHGDGGPAIAAQLGTNANYFNVAVDAVGNAYIADPVLNRVRKITLDGLINTVAGTGLGGFSGDGGLATDARLSGPTDVAVDSSGNLFIADNRNNRVRKVIPDGTISTVFDVGTPYGLGMDSHDNLYIADFAQNRVLKMAPDLTVSIVAGTTRGYSGDGGSALSAQLDSPSAVVVDGAGNVYVADTGNHRIRKIGVDGIITTVAGNGTAGSSGDGGPATAAELNLPDDIVLDASGNLYIAEDRNNSIRKVEGLAGQTLRGFTLSNLGSTSFATMGDGPLRSGYAQIEPASGSTTPSGVAIFGYRTGGILVSEAAVSDSPLITSGRLYAEISAGGVLNTGTAIVNPNPQTATVNFTFVNTAGQTIKTGSFTIEANQQQAMFLNQDPFQIPAGTQGALSFTSNQPVAVIALRGLTNERGEFLMTTLPIIDGAAAAPAGIQLVPHFADGEGWTTQLLLVNPTDTAISGSLQFFSSGQSGSPAEAISMTVNGQRTTSTSYTIPGRSAQKLATSGTEPGQRSGSVKITPAQAGGIAPAALVVFSYKPGAVTVTEAGTAANAGTAFRAYVEASGTPGDIGNIQSGIAIANRTATAANITLQLFDLNGAVVGTPVVLPLAGSAQTARFITEFFPTLPASFQGILRITAPVEISVVGLRGHYNERHDFLITTSPAVNENAPAATTLRVFPQLANGGGYTTKFILFSAAAGQTAAGQLRFFTQAGAPLNLLLQ